MNVPIPTTEARKAGLPGSDTFRASHILYLDDLHRNWGAVRLNLEALKAFTDTIQVSHRAELAAHRKVMLEWMENGALSAGLPYPENKADFDAMVNVHYENLKIATGFELHLKARLFSRSFVVHRIDGSLAQYHQLAREQKRRPIPVAELLAISGYYFDGKLNYLPGLSDNSLNFSTLTTVTQYRNASGLTANELDLIDDYRVLRNQIHLPGDWPETPALQAFGRPFIEFLLPFINKEVVEWSNALITQFGLSFRRFEHFT